MKIYIFLLLLHCFGLCHSFQTAIGKCHRDSSSSTALNILPELIAAAMATSAAAGVISQRPKIRQLKETNKKLETELEDAKVELLSVGG